MKKILLFASAALLFAGCAKENITPTENPDNNSQKGDITLSFSASQTGFGTKAIIGETTTDTEGTKSTAINWQESDKISVFDGDNQNCPFSIKDFSAESPSCTFEGTVTKLATDYTAVYPYTEGATISEDVISGVTLPATQTAVADSFDPKAALMAAKTVGGERELAFKNLVGYVKVTTDFNCKKIELCAAPEEKLAGVGTITFTEGTPSFTLGDGAESTITLLPAGEGTTIAAGKTYYIAVPAGTLAAGWNISFTATNDKVYSRQGTKQIQFKTNTVINLGTISLDDFIPYVTFTAESEQTFKMDFQLYSDVPAFTLGEGEYFEYRVGNGVWTKFTGTIRDVTFGGAGHDLQLRGISSQGTSIPDDYHDIFTHISFGNDTPVSCSGDIRTLVNYKDYENANTSNASFCLLFMKCSQLTSAPDLPATELASKCYESMFIFCSSLQTAPKLPAMTLAEGCYESMFDSCTSLQTAPVLPATKLAVGCYAGMFADCHALQTAPVLPAMTLAEACYANMFINCESLKIAPELPATTLAQRCYEGMFNNCTKLQTAPVLPAETLCLYCYSWMFFGTSINTVTIKAKNLYYKDESDNEYTETLSSANAEYVRDTFQDWIPENSEHDTEHIIYCTNEFANLVYTSSYANDIFRFWRHEIINN
ncbi:MAG: hypothetical protein ACI3ZI_07055 [Candidatus Cryptobacteroides sp.]